MGRLRAFRFDALEPRRLLSGAAQPHVVVHTAVTIGGTLAVKTARESSAMNSDGSETVSIPLTGQLDGLGKVTGTWNETLDLYGATAGLDTIRLRNAQGTIVLGFDNVTGTKAVGAGKGAIGYQHAQHFVSGSGAYAHATETGSVELTSNAARTTVVGMVIASKPTS